MIFDAVRIHPCSLSITLFFALDVYGQARRQRAVKIACVATLAQVMR